ncbi:hypothetical protein BHU72_14655 [Desulfuribacillus stibiiarsenatis]|uniref:Uncharacterized protein n=1 Tax=Desulfuribacillus stibiiarsenatis TaxID=1390249 RepID=A0A1E5L7E1_9FIRM|nr:hypothetical protein [Desulfuribacillus stibiiarsenatis]OEH86067.1 hypothetical protein BHU72_14655 [Desulfuribacillus stibiiarsenatis]
MKSTPGEALFRFFQTDLNESNTIELSFTPNIPIEEKQYKHISHNLLLTVTGYLLILNLESLDNNKQITFCIPDIKNVELNNESLDDNYCKYYLNCHVRTHYYEYQELIEMKNAGIEISSRKIEEILRNINMTYRIIIKK